MLCVCVFLFPSRSPGVRPGTHVSARRADLAPGTNGNPVRRLPTNKTCPTNASSNALSVRARLGVGAIFGVPVFSFFTMFSFLIANKRPRNELCLLGQQDW